MMTSTWGILLLGVFALTGQAPGAPSTGPVGPEAESPEADSPPPTTRRLRVLVLEPTTAGKPEDVAIAKAVSGLVPVELSAVASFDVLSSADVQQMIELEAEKEAIGCADSSCLAELAGALGADLVVFGDVNRLGSLILVNLNLFDSTRAAAAGRVSIQTKNIEELPSKLSPGIRQLVRPFLEKEGILVPAAWDLPAAAATGTPGETASTGAEEGGLGLLSWGLIGAGTLAGLAGAGLIASAFVPYVLAGAAAERAGQTHDRAEYDGLESAYLLYAAWFYAAPVVGLLVVAGGLATVGGGALVAVWGGE